MARRFFAAGSWALVALGLVHLLGHLSLVTNEGQTEAERLLIQMMKGNERDFGAGFVRSTFELLSGFSLTFSVLCFGFGLLGLVLMRHHRGFPPALRAAATVLTAVFGVMTVVAWRYWFLAPLLFLVVAFACFGAALVAAPRPPSDVGQR